MQVPPVKLIECPRDAMQGWPHFIPTADKISYINGLLQVGFDTIDFGSFVSPKAIPQMADTKEVLAGLDMAGTTSKLLAIVANTRGAVDAIQFHQISYLGFPFSISETFQQRNTNTSIETSFETVKAMQELCVANNKKLVIYISMGFGNPYGDIYNEELVFEWVNKMVESGVDIISLADTVGLATPAMVHRVTQYLVEALPQIEIGVHLHSTADNWKQKMDAALEAGCRRFDGALKGIGGCPMAGDDLVGNMNTEWMIPHLQAKKLLGPINMNALELSSRTAAMIFV